MESLPKTSATDNGTPSSISSPVSAPGPSFGLAMMCGMVIERIDGLLDFVIENCDEDPFSPNNSLECVFVSSEIVFELGWMTNNCPVEVPPWFGG